jgi:hypothetical protein
MKGCICSVLVTQRLLGAKDSPEVCCVLHVCCVFSGVRAGELETA